MTNIRYGSFDPFSAQYRAYEIADLGSKKSLCNSSTFPSPSYGGWGKGADFGQVLVEEDVECVEQYIGEY